MTDIMSSDPIRYRNQLYAHLGYGWNDPYVVKPIVYDGEFIIKGQGDMTTERTIRYLGLSNMIQSKITIWQYLGHWYRLAKKFLTPTRKYRRHT